MKKIALLLILLMSLGSFVGAQTLVSQGPGRGTNGNGSWKVDFGGYSQPVSVTGTVPVTFTMPSLVAGTALIGHVIVDSGSITGSVTITGAVDTELPVASALSDSMSNPTTPLIGSSLMIWDTTQWVRARASVGSLFVMSGIQSGAGIAAIVAAGTLGDTSSGISNPGVFNYFYNPATTIWNRARTVDSTSGGNTAGGGISAAGILGMFDDAAPGSITENNFGNLRMSANRNLYSTLRDAAGNERGANVTASNALQVDGSGVTQPANVSQVGGTNTDTNSGLKSAGTLRVVIATDQPALTNKLLVTPDSVALPANQSVNVSQISGTTTSVNSGVKDAGTLRVILATDQPTLTNKLLVTPDSVALPANQSVNVNQFGGSAVVTGVGASGAGVPRFTVANDSNVIVTPPTLTKGTQGATGFSTQDLHDAGRTAISFYANNVASGTTTTETLITLTQSKGTGATSSASTYTITNGKTLRITGISVASRGHATATIQSTVFNLRLNTAGACVVTSTPILFAAQSATPATASAWDRVILPIPEGYEIAGDGTKAICLSAAATFTTNAPTWSVNLIGYEY